MKIHGGIIIGNDLTRIADIYAANGVVQMLLRDGKIINLEPREATRRALKMNEMSRKAGCPDDVSRRALAIVDKTIKAVREAWHQREDSYPSAKQAEVTRLLEGRKKDGSPVTDADFKEDSLIEKYCSMYTSLKDVEVSAVLRNKQLQEPEKEMLMRRMHMIRTRQETEDLAKQAGASPPVSS